MHLPGLCVLALNVRFHGRVPGGMKEVEMQLWSRCRDSSFACNSVTAVLNGCPSGRKEQMNVPVQPTEHDAMQTHFLRCPLINLY